MSTRLLRLPPQLPLQVRTLHVHFCFCGTSLFLSRDGAFCINSARGHADNIELVALPHCRAQQLSVFGKLQAVASCQFLAVGSITAVLLLQPQVQLLHQVRRVFAEVMDTLKAL